MRDTREWIPEPGSVWVNRYEKLYCVVTTDEETSRACQANYWFALCLDTGQLHCVAPDRDCGWSWFA